MAFQNYVESGPALLTDPNTHITGQFTLNGTSSTVANTLRRCILTETRSVGFRADLTDAADPGIKIRKNTSVIFNEMLAHRITLLPLGVVRIDDFDPTRYECVLRVKNEERGLLGAAAVRHVTASDFVVQEKQEDGTFAPLPSIASKSMFPADPITKETALLITLRPQWNPEQPPEEIDLTVYPVIGTGRTFMGFSPVAQCSFGNTRDPDPVRQENFFKEWLSAFKKVDDMNAVNPELLTKYREEWNTMAVQRCFLVDAKGEPNSFDFTVESVGVRPVKDIVAEGIRAVLILIEPYTVAETPNEDLGITVRPIDSRMNGVDVHFEGQEHTLGALLQTLITDLYLDGEVVQPDSPITYVGYKIRHPLQRTMTLRFGFREEAIPENTTAVIRSVIAAAAQKARSIFEELGRSWVSISGGGGAAQGLEAPELDG
jgi:DNA-directed RNA polymerase subunit L